MTTTNTRAKVKRNSATKAGPMARVCRALGTAHEKLGDYRCDYGSNDLGNPVRENVFGLAASANPDPQGHGRIVVTARNMAACKNHDHQG